MEDYKDIQDLLKPRRDIKASAQLRNRVKTSVDRKRRATTLRRNWILGGISAGIASRIAPCTDPLRSIRHFSERNIERNVEHPDRSRFLRYGSGSAHIA